MGMGKLHATDRLALRNAVSAARPCATTAADAWAIKVFDKSADRSFLVLGCRVRSFASMELQDGPLERKRTFRRVRLGPLVFEELCYRSSVSSGMVPLTY